MNPFDGGYNATIQFSGTVSGQMYMDVTTYEHFNCSGVPLFTAHVNGIFDDLGTCLPPNPNLPPYVGLTCIGVLRICPAP